MSTLLEVLFDRANRRLRRLGLLGAVIALPLIVYVEIPLMTAVARDEIENLMRGVTRNIRTHERRAPHGSSQPARLHHGRENRPSR